LRVDERDEMTAIASGVVLPPSTPQLIQTQTPGSSAPISQSPALSPLRQLQLPPPVATATTSIATSNGTVPSPGTPSAAHSINTMNSSPLLPASPSVNRPASPTGPTGSRLSLFSKKNSLIADQESSRMSQEFLLSLPDAVGQPNPSTLNKVSTLTEQRKSDAADRLLGRPFGLLAILTNPMTVELLKDYMASEHNLESVMFWLDVNAYQKLPTDRELDRRQFARNIYDNFIANCAPFQINISADLVQAIAKRMLHPTRSIFDDAQNEVFGLMQTNSWERFKSSPAYEMSMVLLTATQRMEDCRTRLAQTVAPIGDGNGVVNPDPPSANSYNGDTSLPGSVVRSVH
jgi:hypothetical protein